MRIELRTAEDVDPDDAVTIGADGRGPSALVDTAAFERAVARELRAYGLVLSRMPHGGDGEPTGIAHSLTEWRWYRESGYAAAVPAVYRLSTRLGVVTVRPVTPVGSAIDIVVVQL